MAKRGNSEGSIRQRRDGRYEARVSQPDGKRKSYFGKTRKEVADKMTAALRDLQQGKPLPNENKRVGEYLDTWLKDVARPTIRPRTYDRYQLDVKRIKEQLGNVRLARLSVADVQKFLTSLSAEGKAPATVRHCRAVLRAALEHAEATDLIQRNPARGRAVKLPKSGTKPVEALSAKAARALLTGFQGHALGSLVGLALGTGLRQGELLGLRWEDINLDTGLVTVRHQLQKINGAYILTEPKSRQSHRTLCLSLGAVEMLRTHRVKQIEERLRAGTLWTETGHVFTSLVGTPLDSSNVIHRFHAQLRNAGLPRMRFHDLRHGAATLLLEQGATLRDVMEQLGHSQISLTANVYGHVTEQMKRDVAVRMQSALYG